MEITNLTLAYLLLELKPVVESAFVNNIQELAPAVLKFRLNTKEGSRNLVINQNALYLSRYKLQARQNAHGFSAFLKKHLNNKRIVSLRQHEFERIVLIEFDELLLITEFFHEGNIILTDHSYRILNCMRRREWKGRTLRKGGHYSPPPAKGINPAELTPAQLEEFFSRSSADAVRALIAAVNIAPLFAEEILSELGIDKNVGAATLRRKQIAAIHSAVRGYYCNISVSKLRPVISTNYILPFSVKSLGAPQHAADSLNAAIDDFYSRAFLTENSRTELARREKELSSLRSSMAKLLEAKKAFEVAAADNALKGELIYSNFRNLEELVSAISKAEEKGADKKDIVYKLGLAAEKGNKAAKMFLDLNPKSKELFVELQ